MKVLVTGGAGYIGSITVERLIKHGASVVVFDNLYQGHEAAVHPEATFVCGDLADRAAIDETLACRIEFRETKWLTDLKTRVGHHFVGSESTETFKVDLGNLEVLLRGNRHDEKQENDDESGKWELHS